MIRIAVSGACGRMGRSVVAACHAAPNLVVVAALERSNVGRLGTDAGEVAGVGEIGVPIRDKLNLANARPDVLIDFSAPEATLEQVRQCVSAGVHPVIGTTGLTDAALKEIDKAATKLAVVLAPNMSVGINLMFALTAIAARALQLDADVEIIEAHHAAKRDAPSGTALRLGQIVRRERDSQQQEEVYGRGGKGARRPGSIGYATVRAADIVGEHTVLYAWPGERLELVHRATDRAIFAAGAVRAARWVVDQPPGLYDMQDVLDLRSLPAASSTNPALPAAKTDASSKATTGTT